MARLSEAAIERLDDARQRYDAISNELSDPAVFGDQRRAADLAREQSELGPVLDQYAQYQLLVTQVGHAEEILADGADEELRDLARDELVELEPRIDEI